MGSGENRSTTSRNGHGPSGSYVCTRSALEIKRLAVQIWRGLSKPRAREELHCSLSLEIDALVRFGCRIWKPGADPVETRTKRKGGLQTYRPVIAQYTARDVTKHRLWCACWLCKQRWYLGRPNCRIVSNLPAPSTARRLSSATKERDLAICPYKWFRVGFGGHLTQNRLVRPCSDRASETTRQGRTQAQPPSRISGRRRVSHGNNILWPCSLLRSSCAQRALCNTAFA